MGLKSQLTRDTLFLCLRIRKAPLGLEAKGVNAQGEGHVLSCNSYLHSQTRRKGAVACEYLFKLRKQEVSIRRWGVGGVCGCVCMLMALL